MPGGQIQVSRMVVQKPFHLLINDYLSFSSYWSVIENQDFSPTWTLFSFLYLCTTIKNDYSYWIPFHPCPLHQKSVFQIPMTSKLPELMNLCIWYHPTLFLAGKDGLKIPVYLKTLHFLFDSHFCHSLCPFCHNYPFLYTHTALIHQFCQCLVWHKVGIQ